MVLLPVVCPRCHTGQVIKDGKTKEPRWLWHAIDHRTGKVLAFVFGRRKEAVFLKLKALLEPFGITRYHTLMTGAPIRVTSTTPSTIQASGTHSRSSANI